jgi:hypothetical protein
MPTFTKEEMLKELATIFLFEADHITIGASLEKAVQFIGFENEASDYCLEPAEKVNLKSYNICSSFERGYEYAFQPSVINNLREDEVQDLNVFMEGTPKAGGQGETHKFMTPDGLCQSLADAVHARWKLEWQPGNEFTPRELALLANMTEGAVRNAITDKSENGIRPVPGTKNPVKISQDESHRWLLSRRGFIPGPSSVKDDRLLLENFKKAESAPAFGKLIGRVALALRINEADFTSLDFESWRNGTFVFNKQDALELAQKLEIDIPIFVGKALELSMRRDQV